MTQTHAFFHDFVKARARQGQLVVQPRMGFSDAAAMRRGLEAVAAARVPAIGTITLDSFTRTGDFASARRAVQEGKALNGYPIVTYSDAQNRQLLAGLRGPDFPVQVRHGSSLPEEIFRAIVRAGLDATEGGPISYCLPYGRVPLAHSIEAWRRCTQLFAAASPSHHIESFGGCMMGQLCPPSMLIAITLIEALFFQENGLRSLSVSLAQGTNARQDVAALRALRQLGEEYLGPAEHWHIVFYTFMGKFPQTYPGARALMEESARIARAGGAERLIVKTVKEAHQIPQIQDNLDALCWSYQAACEPAALPLDEAEVQAATEVIVAEARCLLHTLLNLGSNIGRGIELAFARGYWDVPFCLHPDNRRRSFACIDERGYTGWAATGRIPFPRQLVAAGRQRPLTSGALFDMLSYNQLRYDAVPALAG
ncbi:methylaspartate mutase [Hymenobacter sp. B81]|uniref:methylaspartate mutase n=1 Tax=Hymenobacter sp. B81 TaxID=3344878 RepID=UPI0037DD107F